MREFRPSLRGTMITATFLAVASWLVLRVALRMDPRPATIATICALSSLLAVRLAFWRPERALRLGEDGLSVRTGREKRDVPWSAVRHVGLAYGEVETPRGLARVPYAKVEVSSGPPIAFADLSVLDGAEVVLEGTPMPVIDVADPEVLLAIISERVGARGSLPEPQRSSAVPQRNRLGGMGAAVVVLRAVFFAVLGVSAAEMLWDASTAVVAATIAGVAMAIAVAAAAQFAGSRIALPGPTHTPAVAALFPTLLAALGAWRFASTGEHGVSVSWMLATALILALPVAPLPGVAIARSLGAHLARPRSDAPAAALLAVTGAVIAILLSRGMKVLPIALLAGGAEAAEGYLAGLRAARLRSAPRFAEWPLHALEELRGMLRATFDDELADRSAALDRAVLERTEMLRRLRPAPLSILLGALFGLALTAAVAHHALHAHGASDAIRILVR